MGNGERVKRSINLTRSYGHYSKIELPKPDLLIRKRTPEYIVGQLIDIKERFDRFFYRESHDDNDIREAHLKFLHDSEKFKDWLCDTTADILELYELYDRIREHIKELKAMSEKYTNRVELARSEAVYLGVDLLNPLKKPNEIAKTVRDQQKDLLRRKRNMDEMEHEIVIKEEMLQKKKSEMELALQHRYTLTETQKKVLIDEKDMILDGIEEWGTVSGALSHNKKITSKASTILSYCQMFPEFGQAIEISKAIFRDKIDSTLIDRAIEGTENPQFFKGECFGNYKIKNDKLLVELAKAKLPDQYNQKTKETNKNTQINNISITSFANINETDLGFKKDVGVVLNVDDTGKVERITTDANLDVEKMERLQNQEKMVNFYKKKEGAEIIEPEQLDEDKE